MNPSYLNTFKILISIQYTSTSDYGNYIYGVLQLSLDILYLTGRSSDHVTLLV